MVYNWQREHWPEFSYGTVEIGDKLYLISEKTGLISGSLRVLPDDTQLETIIQVMVAEAIKTSEIEGEYISRKDVMSSIKRGLGLVDKNFVTDP